MNFSNNLIKDPRTRYYLPINEIVCDDMIDNVQFLVGNEMIQPVAHFPPPLITFPPGKSAVMDFGKAFHGGIRIISSVSGGRVEVQFGESVSEAIGKADQDHSRRTETLFLPRSGMIEYGNLVFRFVRITNIGECDLQIFNIMGIVLERDIDVTGSFESSDERLNQIWKTAIRTVHLCMQEYIYDGAKRDRLVWMGDMHPEIKGILCAFSDTSIIVESLEFLMRQSRPDQPMNQIYTYSCWFIISVWDYYCASGDNAFIERHAQYFDAMLKLFSGFVGENGSECIPERRFLDWPNDENIEAKHAGIQALMLWMMVAGEKLLRTLDMDYTRVVKAQQKLRRHVPDPAGRKAPAALLTLTGLANRRDVLEQDPFRNVSTFYGYYMLLAKDTVPALELIKRYWGGMLDYGATSFWEDFDLDWIRNSNHITEPPVSGKDDLHADFGNYCYKGLRHSLSHGWSCGPAPFLSERVLGVRFPKPGKVSIQPDLGSLEFVRGCVPTPFGPVKVEADCSGKFLAEIPDGLQQIAVAET